jgi:HSP20 family protein
MSLTDLLPSFRRNEPVIGSMLMPLQRQIDRIFEDFWASGGVPAWQRSVNFVPRIEIVESDKDLMVMAELPGMDENDVELIIEKRLLTIRGEKSVHHEEKGEGRCYSECSSGSFERQIPLGFDIEEGKVEATFNRGVLNIVLPKSEEARTRSHKIKIHSASTKESRSKGGLFKGRNGAQESAAQSS